MSWCVAVQEDGIEESDNAVHPGAPGLQGSAVVDWLAERGRWRTLLEHLHEGIVFCELISDSKGVAKDYRYIHALGAAEAVAGVSAVGQLAYEVHPALEKSWLLRFARVVSTGHPAVFTHFAAPLGRWFHVRACPCAENKFVLFFLDVTKEKTLEARSREERQAQLRVSRLNAMAALASTLAHELNQPLAAAANYLAALDVLLQGGGDSTTIRETAAAASAAHLRAGEIIKRMKLFALEGRIDAKVESLSDIVGSAWSAAMNEFVAGGILLHLSIPAEINVLAEKLQIEQVFINLFRNAAQALHNWDGLRQISVVARKSSDFVLISVDDSGPGIPADQLPSLFEAFHSQTGGMGLGLAICRTIVEAHGGTIRAIKSADGAAFRIRLRTGSETS